MVVARYQHRWLKDGFSARLEVRPYTELAYRKKPEISVARAVGQILQRFQRQNCRKLLVEMLDRLTPVENEEREKKRGLLRRPEDESCIVLRAGRLARNFRPSLLARAWAMLVRECRQTIATCLPGDIEDSCPSTTTSGQTSAIIEPLLRGKTLPGWRPSRSHLEMIARFPPPHSKLKLISFAGGALGSSTGNALSARNQLLSVCISTEVGAAFSHLADRDN
ncbi:uncharacterized protein GLRG_01964 [Colletotrichum graminicola M1.001]|uniref:Uncharacterized protein n=1 Tax=Colletotrichum graminicola (strain M1.001 / M2 / FGSC 10212) TaxID=645133 RepID=E3Q8V5_COLGM|nr:uncharacterized protein GLRG_01964 [Colletotrichum graminicola M1.001]EFQ27469.1 hypothetical protein GLRG_01964 [Colletotrichum graminicola M1.001]